MIADYMVTQFYFLTFFIGTYLLQCLCLFVFSFICNNLYNNILLWVYILLFVVSFYILLLFHFLIHDEPCVACVSRLVDHSITRAQMESVSASCLIADA